MNHRARFAIAEAEPKGEADEAARGFAYELSLYRIVEFCPARMLETSDLQCPEKSISSLFRIEDEGFGSIAEKA
jgi:hypothetical protein